MLKIGVTGGIGSGKSVVCQIFNTFGIPIYNADIRAKWIQNNDKDVINNIKLIFGENSYLDGNLNRYYISQIVFSDINKLKLLNEIVHPVVFKDYKEWLSENINSKYIIKESALIQDSSNLELVDELILITCPIGIRIKRIMKRDFFRNPSEIARIINNQISDENRLPWVNYKIVNDGYSSLIKSVEELHQKFSAI